MPQEEVEKKSCDLAIQVSKLSVKEIAKGVDKYLKYLKQRKINKTQVDRSIKGKQTVKQLISQGQGVASMPIGDTHLKDFERVARKYGVDFAVVKDTADDKPRYTVFFKAVSYFLFVYAVSVNYGYVTAAVFLCSHKTLYFSCCTVTFVS